MDYKKRLGVGLLITAIITPLLLSNLMPPLFAGVIVLVAGVACAYFWALDYVKENKIEDMAMLVKALESLNQAQDENEVLNLFISWAKKLTATSEHYLWLEGEEASLEWQAFMNKYGENGEMPASFAAGLFIPIMAADELVARVILVDKDMQKIPPVKLKLIQALLNAVSAKLNLMAQAEEERTFNRELLEAVIRATEGYNPLMVGHSAKVAKIAQPIGRCLGLNEEELKNLEYAALLHDLGQMAIIYGGITEAQAHPELGSDLLPAGDEFAGIKEGILHHHEHYDGSGYPEGLGYTDIPLTARIIAVAATYAAITFLGTEEERLKHEQALTYIKKGIGTYFDPLVVVALEEVAAEVGEILKEYSGKTDK